MCLENTLFFLQEFENKNNQACPVRVGEMSHAGC